MIREKLLQSAEKICKADKESIREYVDKQEILLAMMNESMLSRKDIMALIGGKNNIEIMKDNHANHLRFIASLLSAPDAETLVEVIAWVFRVYKNRGFDPGYWSAQINTWIQLLHAKLSRGTLNDILPIYEWMSVNIPIFEGLETEAEHT